MGNVLYVLAVVLVILWGIGYIGYNYSSAIHILLFVAAIAIIVRIIQGRKNI